MFKLDPFEEVLADFRAGRMVIMVDDEDRENEGDIVVATEKLTADHVVFMMEKARGLICISLDPSVVKRLDLPMQAQDNNSPFHTAFTLSVDHREVSNFGVGAQERVFTMKALIDPSARADDFVVPGFCFPLVANPAGTLGREGQTEGSYDFARLAGFEASGVICEILNEDGTMARGEQLMDFARKYSLKITSVAAVRDYRIAHQVYVRAISRRPVETEYGTFQAISFQDDVENKEHIAMVFGDENLLNSTAVLVRLHSECLTGDVFGSRRCDCGLQLNQALKQIVSEGSGVLLYLRQEGRGIGLSNKLRAYELQDQGHDTVDANLKLGFAADERNFVAAANIIRALGINSVRILTNNPDKINTLEECGIKVVERIASIVPEDEYSEEYLKTKRDRMGHILP